MTRPKAFGDTARCSVAGAPGHALELVMRAMREGRAVPAEAASLFLRWHEFVTAPPPDLQRDGRRAKVVVL